ncbi:MAG: hypothetical protein KJ927_03540 [Candidatus Eisenbacteria bacterium]|nr:hypothetical protein [Candidatus Eisenbacteria bacterium]MBU1947765.1 hypothetical protein [Candidatus Eisenbacteria bacterium]
MSKPDRYLDLDSPRRELKPTYHFVMKCLLYSRMETGLVSNKDYYDEDVNVYIAHLLNAFFSPEYVQHAAKYLSPYDTEVFEKIAHSTDARLKYSLYKTNADFLLISLGIFDNPRANQNGNNKQEEDWEEPGQKPVETAHVGRGKAYYHFAYTFSQQIHSPGAGITEVLEKLSIGFDKYTRILTHMRGEYLDLMQRLSKGEVYHLERSVNESQIKEQLRSKQDELLDLYLEWKRTKDGGIKEKLDGVVSEIRKMDPTFNFELQA